MRFPWQKQQWQQLWYAKQENRLAHALLFSGIKGTGKSHFADHFARALLCQASNTSSTDTLNCHCHSCRLMTGKAHPNMLWIMPEKDSQAIKIDQIREVSEFINQTSLQGAYRIVIINPAQQMNKNAANALLKTLEEPPLGALLMLICDQLAHLPATILSRCQHVLFSRPSLEQSLPWLKEQLKSDQHDPDLLLRLTHGAPLAAIQFVKDEVLPVRQHLFQTLYALIQQQADPIQAATSLSGIDSLRFLDFLLSFIVDILRLQLGASANRIVNADFATQIMTLHQDTLLNKNIKFMEYLQQLRGQICTGINMNKQLMIENVLIHWTLHHAS